MKLTGKFARLLLVIAFVLPFFLHTQVQAEYTGHQIHRAGRRVARNYCRLLHTTTYRLATYNYITDPNMVVPGRKLTIPGFEDLSGEITRVIVGLGDTPSSLARQTGSNTSVFQRINFLTSADAIYVGQPMFVLDQSITRKRVPITEHDQPGAGSAQ